LFYKRSLAIGEKLLGADNPGVAVIRNNLGELYRQESRYDQAEDILRHSLKALEAAPPSSGLDLATTLDNLALVCQDKGNYGEAESLHRRALSVLERLAGPEHPDVAKTLSSLAMLTFEEGRYAEAENLLQRSLFIMEKAVGPEHPDTALLLNNLAGLYQEITAKPNRFTNARWLSPKRLWGPRIMTSLRF
jgi:tetratricopeptide (TPR) repeat protein